MTDHAVKDVLDLNADAGREATPAASAPVVPSLVVAAVSFLIILAMILSVWVMGSRQRAAAEPPARPAVAALAASGQSDIVLLLENNYFVTPLPPTGDRSVTYQYSVAVKVARGRRTLLDALIAPDGRNMLPAVREQVRRIIAAEDYLKLRSEQLDDVKRRIRHALNGLMGADVVEDVIFDKWNVMS